MPELGPPDGVVAMLVRGGGGRALQRRRAGRTVAATAGPRLDRSQPRLRLRATRGRRPAAAFRPQRAAGSCPHSSPRPRGVGSHAGVDLLARPWSTPGLACHQSDPFGWGRLLVSAGAEAGLPASSERPAPGTTRFSNRGRPASTARSRRPSSLRPRRMSRWSTGMLCTANGRSTCSMRRPAAPSRLAMRSLNQHAAPCAGSASPPHRPEPPGSPRCCSQPPAPA